MAGIALGGLLAAGAPAARAGNPVTPEVRIQASRVVGDSDSTASVKKGVAAGRAGLLGCYTRNLTTHPGEVGELALSVRIATTGKVTTISVVRSAINADLRKCLFALLKTWRLSPWKARVRQFASVELVFQLSAAKPRKALVRGGIPTRLVAGTVEARLPALLKRCLKGAALTNRRWPPRLNIIVDYDGTVQTATVSGRLPRRAVRKCLVDHVRLWDFPPPDNGHRTWVYWPLVGPVATKSSAPGGRPLP
jgi:hypothetical protein